MFLRCTEGAVSGASIIKIDQQPIQWGQDLCRRVHIKYGDSVITDWATCDSINDFLAAQVRTIK